MRLRTAMGMSVDGDGDLGAVVWGIPSAPGLHSHHTASSSSSSASSSRGRSAEEASSFVSIRGQNHPPLSIFKESGLNFGSSQDYHFPSVAAFEGDDFFPLTKAANASTPKAGARKPDPGEIPQKSTHSKQISRRRKLQQKRIVYVPVSGDGRPSGETLPSDMWAWRKYGQKPIKGSPYPRGYYRCSSSKGCSARKQVERSQTDPSMLIITYTSDHNHTWPAHRNSLAGTTRPKSSIQKVGSNAVASDPPHQLSAAINNPDTPSILEKTLSGQIGFLLGNHSGNLDSVSKANSQEEEFFLEFNELPEFSSALKKPFLDERSDDEGANVEVDPYNLFCWSAGGFPTS